MSEINLNYVVQPTEVALQVVPNEIAFTPNPINLTITTLGAGGGNVTVPGGFDSWVQLNSGGTFAGASGLKYVIETGTTTANILVVPDSANINNANITNVVTSGTATFASINTFTGAITANGTSTFNGITTVNNTLAIQQGKEKAVIITDSTGGITLDVTQGAVFHLTNTLTGNIQLNFTNLPTVLPSGDTNDMTFTVTVITKVGATAYYPTSVTTGSTTTTKWFNGAAPSASNIVTDCNIFYTLTFMRTGALVTAYTVWASFATFI